MTMDKVQARADRLVAATRSLQAKLEASPKHPKAKAWRARLAEYEQSIGNLLEHGRETQPRGNAGANIELPADIMRLLGRTPGAEG